MHGAAVLSRVALEIPSHSILNEFMHAEYGNFVYTVWPLFGAAPKHVWTHTLQTSLSTGCVHVCVAGRSLSSIEFTQNTVPRLE